MMRNVLPIIFLLGCQEQPPPLRLHAFLPTSPGPHLEVLSDEILDACELLMVECRSTEKWRGAIYLDLVNQQPGETAGRTPKKIPAPCYRMTRSANRPTVIAHELAHALGVLGHSDDPDNVLHEQTMGTYLTADQQDTIDRTVRKLWRCRPGKR